MNFRGYEYDGFFDEMIGEGGTPRHAARALVKDIETLEEGELLLRQKAAESALVQAGFTFSQLPGAATTRTSAQSKEC